MANKFYSLILTLICSISAWSKDLKTVEYKGVDIAPLIQFFEGHVSQIQNEVIVYNWSQAGKASDAALQGMAQRSSNSFWGNYGRPEGNQNMYGFGLYAALDPVVTATYGGYFGSNSDKWLLTELYFPPGLRYLDLVNLTGGSQYAYTPEVQKLMGHFQCPLDGGENKLFVTGGSELNPNCRGLVKKIFKDELKIDAFAYSYSATLFKECKEGMYDIFRAFVIVDSKWMGKDSVKYYKKDTTDKLEDRIRIQTLFLKEDEVTSAMDRSNLKKPIAQFLKNNPTYQFVGSQTKCDDSYCVITVKFCANSDQCSGVSLEKIPRPGGALIKRSEAAKGKFVKTLLWDDLEGVPKAPSISTWLKEKMHGCGAK